VVEESPKEEGQLLLWELPEAEELVLVQQQPSEVLAVEILLLSVYRRKLSCQDASFQWQGAPIQFSWYCGPQRTHGLYHLFVVPILVASQSEAQLEGEAKFRRV
jgi:hypothetical protein